MTNLLNISSLSDVEVKELLQLAIRKEEADNARRIDVYKPHSGAWRGKPDDGQKGFHISSARIRVLLGGNQSGKTIAGVVEAVWYALGIHPYKKIRVPNRGRVIASLGFEEGANQNIVPKLWDWLPKGALKGKPRFNQAGIPATWEFNNGSVINILSGEQEDKVFEGWTGDWAWIDEPCRKQIYEATRRGLLRNKGDIWFTLTPLTEPWLFNDIYEPCISGERKDVEAFHIDTWDNAVSNGGYLPDDSIREFEKDLPDDLKESRIHGKFRFLSGRIYPQFDPKLHIVPQFEVPKHWEVWDGFDPHLRKEHAYCQWAISPQGEIYVCNEIYSKMTIPELAEAAKRLREGKNITCTLIDTSAETPDALYRITPRRLLEQHGIHTRLADKNKNVSHGIHVMRDLLTPKMLYHNKMAPQFYVMNHCHRHIKEFQNYVQDDRDSEYVVKDTPRKIWDDMMDLDRYLVVEHPLLKNKLHGVKYSSFLYGRRDFDEEDKPSPSLLNRVMMGR